MNTPITATSSALFDTDTGQITGGITRAAGVGVVSNINFTLHTYMGRSIGVFAIAELSVTGTGTIRFKGSRAAALLIRRTLDVAGELDASAGAAARTEPAPAPREHLACGSVRPSPMPAPGGMGRARGAQTAVAVAAVAAAEPPVPRAETPRPSSAARRVARAYLRSFSRCLAAAAVVEQGRARWRWGLPAAVAEARCRSRRSRASRSPERSRPMVAAERVDPVHRPMAPAAVVVERVARG